MTKEIRQSHPKTVSKCDLQSCSSKSAPTVEIHTKRDTGAEDRQASFCSIAHAMTWLWAYASREKSGWKGNVPNQSRIDGMELMVNEMIDDPELVLGED